MGTPHDLFRQTLASTGDRIAALKAVRLQFGLDLRQAKVARSAVIFRVRPPDYQLFSRTIVFSM